MKTAMIVVWLIILTVAAFNDALVSAGNWMSSFTTITAQEMKEAQDEQDESRVGGYTLNKGCAALTDYLILRGAGTDSEVEAVQKLRSTGTRIAGGTTHDDYTAFGDALRDVATLTGDGYAHALDTANEYCGDATN